MTEKRKERLQKHRKNLENFRGRFSKKQVHSITIMIEIVYIIIVALEKEWTKLSLLTFEGVFEEVGVVLLGGLLILFLIEVMIFDLDRNTKKIQN